MKKALITLIAAALLASALVIPASASNFTHLANDLNSLGLFKGTETGYDLDRAPNRVEGLVMLLRLYGLEEEALACASDHPFSDVSGWQTPYIAYAFENSLTNGTSDTTYSPSETCNAQMYVTFVLRALGYSDKEGGDFTYAGAIKFAESLGIIDEGLSSGVFLRDQMVAVSYLALLAEPKDGEFDCLLEKLVADGAVKEDAAAVFMAKVALLAEFDSLDAGIDEPSVAMSIKISADAGDIGKMLMDMDISMIAGDDDILAAITMSSNIFGEEQAMQMYMADGNIYIDAEGQKIKISSESDGNSELASAAGLIDMDSILGMANIDKLSFSALSIAEITKSTEGDFTVYSIKFSEGLMDSIMDLIAEMTSMMGLKDAGFGDLDLSVNITGLKYYIDAGGKLKKIEITMNMSMTLDVEGVSLPVSIAMKEEIEIKAVGGAVKVELPKDLDDYLTI